MSRAHRWLPVAFALLVPPSPKATATVLTGSAAEVTSCALRALQPCEVAYAIKMDGGNYDDWQFHLLARGGGTIGFDPDGLQGPSFELDASRFTRPERPADAAWILTSPFFDEVAFFSAPLAADMDLGVVRHQLVGDSPPLPASAGIVIPTTNTTYTAPTPGGSRMSFPILTTGGRLLAFAPVADLGVMTGAACEIGGYAADPATGRGIVRGYNIYRTEYFAQFADTESLLRTAWLDFVDLDTFDMTTTGNPDRNRSDLSYFSNPDGLPYTGDEVVYYSDSITWPGGWPRPQGPGIDWDYWYAIQPVFRGDIDDFANVSLAGAPPRDLRISWGPGRVLDAVDVDGDGVPELASPQAQAGHDGLALVNLGSTDPLCAPRPLRRIYSVGAWHGGWSLGAAEHVTATAVVEGQDIVLTVSFGSETGSVISFDVIRRHGVSRVRVNDEPILLAGSDGVAHVLRDAGAAGMPGAARSLQYDVVLRLVDGGEDTAGPFRPEPGGFLRRRR